jgi:hypothetical protein
LFLLAGAAAWVVFERRRRKLVYAACLVAGAAAVAYCHQFGGALVVVGFVAGWVASGVSAPGRSKQAAVVGGLCALALGIGLMEQWRTRSVLPVSGFEAAVRDCLDAHSGRGEFLLTPHWEIDWQEKTGHPVLYTYELPQYITYMPGLAPDILALRADIYDIWLGLPWDYGLGAWRTRSNAEWKRLAAEYGFSHVLSPMDVVLDLRRVMPGPPYDVYAVE